MKKLKIIRSFISVGSYQNFVDSIFRLVNEKESSYICVSNVHMTVEAYSDSSYLDIVNNADITTPDGMPLAKAIECLYGIEQERVAGMDLMPSLMQECEKKSKSIFLYGSTNDVLKKITKRAKNDFPLLKLEAYSPPFRALSSSEKDEIIRKMDGFDFVFVALGCPKQEKWMAEHKERVKSCMVGLGGAFEVYAGVKERAPIWMQKYSLEWLYRLLQDPQRLWKRYFYTNTLFIILFIKQFITQKLFKKSFHAH